MTTFAHHPALKALGLLLLRAHVGLSILLAHGLPKLHELGSGQGHFPELVRQMGFPAPNAFAWLAMLTQVLGSVALVLGIFGRVAALGVASTLAIGMIGVHWGDPFAKVEAGIAYVVVLVTIAALSTGDLSVDAWWRRRRTARRQGGELAAP